MTPAFEIDIRLGQLSELTGMSPLLIRAWERRYGFPVPIRTAGGHRRYAAEQVEALRRAAALVRSGFRASDAIARARQGPVGERSAAPDGADVERLASLIIEADPGRALDHLRGNWLTIGFEPTFEERVLPALHLIGKRWQEGLLSVAQEHIATGVVMSWLGLVRAETAIRDLGPLRYLIATPDGEQHGVGMLGLELMLRTRSVAALALGTSIPVPDLVSEVVARRPEGVVLGILRTSLKRVVAEFVAALPDAHPTVYVGGSAAIRPLPSGVIPLAGRLSAIADLLAMPTGQ